MSKNSIMQLRICSILVLFVFLCKLQWLNRRHYLWSYPCATMNLVVSEKFAFFFFFLLLLLNKISIPGDIQHQVALPECSQHPDLAVGIPVIAGELDDMIFMGHFQFKQFWYTRKISVAVTLVDQINKRLVLTSTMPSVVKPSLLLYYYFYFAYRKKKRKH